MSYRRIPLVLKEFYHIYNRGVDKRVIFKDSSDHDRFIELLYLSNSTHAINIRDIRNDSGVIFDYERGDRLVAIGAYCLMPNHFHILMTPLQENGIQLFMKKLSTGYSMYFNKRYERSGTLFQGRYKSEFVDSDRYLKYLHSYIHLNPLKIIDPKWRDTAVKSRGERLPYLEKYIHSSYLDYLEVQRVESKILNREFFPLYFESPESFLKEIHDWITFS